MGELLRHTQCSEALDSFVDSWVFIIISILKGFMPITLNRFYDTIMNRNVWLATSLFYQSRGLEIQLWTDEFHTGSYL